MRGRGSPAWNHPTEPITSKRVKWPPGSNRKEWFGEDTAQIISSMWKGDVNSRLQAMSAVTVSYRAERFGQEKEMTSKAPYTMNRRVGIIHQLRQEL